MASGSLKFGTSNSYTTGRISWQAYADNATNNRSHVYVQLDYYKSSSTSTYGTMTGYLCGNYFSTGKIYLNSSNGWVRVASCDYWVGHNADGSGGCTISASGGISGTSLSSSSVSKWIGFDKIARYFSSNPTISYVSSTIDSITYKWTTPQTCNYINLYLDGTSTVSKSWSGSATSGTITVTGLSPNTSHTARINARRADSSLWTYSGWTAANKTLPLQVTVGECSPATMDITTAMSVSIPLTNYGADGSSYAIKYEYLKGDGTWAEFLNSDGTPTAATLDETTATYTFDLSPFYSTILANCKTRWSTQFRTTCTSNNQSTTATCTLNVKDYSISWSGITVSDSVTKPSGVSTLGTGVLVQNKGNLRVSTSALATTSYSADIVSYQMTVTNTNTANTVRTSPIFTDSAKNYDVGALNEVGTLSISVIVTDSRGKTSTSTKTIQSLQYSSPNASFALKRQNEYEDKIYMTISGSYSRLYYGSANKNTVDIKYRFKEVNDSDYGSYTTISKENGYLALNTAASAMIASLSYSRNTSSAYFMAGLDSNMAYLFEFVLTDSYGTSFTTVVQVNEGIPLFGVMNNKKLISGVSPTTQVLSDSAKMILDGDIRIDSTVDSSGNVDGIVVGEALSQLNSDLDDTRNDLATTNDVLSNVGVEVDDICNEIIDIHRVNSLSFPFKSTKNGVCVVAVRPSGTNSYMYIQNESTEICGAAYTAGGTRYSFPLVVEKGKTYSVNASTGVASYSAKYI